MCNLYRMTKNKDEVAKWFDLVDSVGGANFAAEVYPGYPGLVVADGAVKSMTWGFPLVMKGKNGQPLKPKPVNNARTDKLDSFFWRHSFEQRRCLIPVSAWAEAQGPKGAKTRTWLSVLDTELFAVAGVWRDSDEFGLCYSMVMTDSAGSAAHDVHSRMPVLLSPEQYESWLFAAPDEAKSLCTAWPGAIAIDRTDQPWTRGVAVQKNLF
ncbi:MAG: SOS response-associated peptidase family protein [Erythrobacter sp.]|uniref:SOS response-associated peptidase n=1 Tax=Erythrobacter sp. TaxID=1042 RepID=UPI002629E874|nr:SOS response-associated peptidase family protein [Erythrobacter sp.]MDJ0977094.1 SOS response-associated peptidase family protein [Erythrobacter sp.]